MSRLFLIDAYALIYRSYYAFINRPMRNREGMNTSAVFGFTKFLREIIVSERPHHLGVAFDPKGGTFRNELFPAYKANRSETPEDILAAVPYIKSIIHALRIPCLEVAGYEADDVIGTLSVKAAREGYEVFMVTPDKDFGQLVQPGVRIYKQGKNGEGVQIVGPQQIREQYGIEDPKLIIDILALWGDASDNIPGVPGIGEKGAVKLVSRYGTVENILANIDELSGKVKENILASRDQLMLSKRLATIDTDAPVEFDPAALVMEDPDCDALRDIYKELDFSMFIREMDTDECSPFNRAPQPGVAPPEDRTAERREARASLGIPENDAAAGTGAAAVSSTASATVSSTVSAAASAAVPAGGDVQYDLFGNPVRKPAAKGAAAQPGGRSAAEEAGYDTVSTTPHRYHTVTTRKQLEALVALLGAAEEFAFDTETSGFDCFNDRIVGISFAIKEGEAWYVPIPEGDGEGFLSMLKPVFENGKIAKTGQNIKFDMMMLAEAGIEVRGTLHDTMILHYLLDPESRHGMNHLARQYLNYSPIEIETLIGRGARQLTMDRVPLETVSEYGAEDSDVTMRLKNVLWPQVIGQGFGKLYTDIEEPLIRVLAGMELAGVRIDSEKLAGYGRELTVQMNGIEERIRSVAGDPSLNVNSPQQLGALLFDKLKLDPKPKRTKTRQYSTDEEYLQSLSDRHEIIGMILEYRGLKKLVSTYIDALPLLVNRKTGRVHTSFNQAVTSTGRLSSANPNLQNIPIRNEQGRRIREAFVPSDDGCLLLSADYSQIELRIMAHLSGDANLIEAFEQGMDIHAATASRLFNVPLSEVTAEHRRKAKTANFGIIYGISAFGLRQRMGGDMTLSEAKEIIDGYFRAYPGVKKYMEDVIGQARETGYVETIFGRRRWLPDIRSSNSTVRGLAERNAINAPIQGSAADIIKIAMDRIHRRFHREGIKSKMILQVHDELVIDMLRTEQERVAAIVVGEMENAAELKVKLVADWGVGENWLQAH